MFRSVTLGYFMLGEIKYCRVIFLRSGGEMKIKYDLKKGLSINGDIQELGEEIYNIKNKTPKSVLQFAKDNKQSILYKQFEWDNKKAGEKYRVSQARKILNHIMIREIEEEEINIRAFESIHVEEEDVEETRIFVNTIDALQNDDQRKLILNEIKVLFNQASNKLDAYNSCISLLLNRGIFK